MLARRFAELGCEQVIVKVLAPNQDNEKNQVYLGTKDSLLTLLPGTLSFLAESRSVAKRHSQLGIGKEVLHLNFSWISDSGDLNPAPHAKVICYLQYPELRFSGFLKDCSDAPRSLRRDSQDDYQWRVLFLGVKGEEVIGSVVTDRNGERLLSKISELPLLPGQDLIRVLPLANSLDSPDLTALLDELGEAAGNWHEAMALTAGADRPSLRQSQQGSGWTLEALLGIPMNSTKGPDKFGYEIKALAPKSAISLITSEPDFGLRKELGLSEFLHGFGWQGTKNDGSFRFNGEHNTQRPYHKSGARVLIDHWDYQANGPDGTGEPVVRLVHESSGAVLAGWSLGSLTEKWNKKHSGCVYVEYQRFPVKGSLASHYRYGPTAYCGLGTSVNRLLRGLASGLVYLDPGDRVDVNGKEKHRMQWRSKPIRNHSLSSRLPELYADWEPVRLWDLGDATTVPTFLGA